MPKAKATKRLIKQLTERLYSRVDPEALDLEGGEAEHIFSGNSPEFLGLLRSSGFADKATPEDLEGLFYLTDSPFDHIPPGTLSRLAITLPDELPSYRGIEVWENDGPGLISSHRRSQSTTLDPKVAEVFGSTQMHLSPGKQNRVLPNPWDGTDELIIPPRKRLQIIRDKYFREWEKNGREGRLNVRRLDRRRGGLVQLAEKYNA